MNEQQYSNLIGGAIAQMACGSQAQVLAQSYQQQNQTIGKELDERINKLMAELEAMQLMRKKLDAVKDLPLSMLDKLRRF